MQVGDRRLPVQQPCSNPSRRAETTRKAIEHKYACLQLFCKLRKGPAKCRAAFARRRPGVRVPSAPLSKCADLQVKLKIKNSSPIASQALVQQPCSNAEGRMRRPDQRRSGVQAPRPTTLVKASHTTPNAKTNTPKHRGLAARAITQASRPAARARKCAAPSGAFYATGS